MARKVRLYLEDTALHIAVSGIEDIFRDSSDYLTYKDFLKEVAAKIGVEIFAYSLRKKSIHLLCMFYESDAASRFMQSVGLKYVSYFNKKYNRKGTLWDGRYRASFVEDKLVVSVMCYIESLDGALCSSLNKNAYCVEDKLVSMHQMYRLLGSSDEQRATIYRRRLESGLDGGLLELIENGLLKQTITGSLEFCKKIEKLVGISLREKKRGRPKKIKKDKEKDMAGKYVVLDKEKHKSLKVSPLEDLNFAKEMTFVPLLAGEAEAVGEVFPVVFTGDEVPSLVALTSLGKENLAINEEGKYITRYVPAFLRKYPFALAPTKDDPEKKVILIDEEASVVSKTKGKQLFTKDGEESEVLKNAVKFLTDYEEQLAKTKAIAKAIKDAGILEEREISIGEGEDKKVLVKGFFVVSREKLNKLDDKTLASWVRNGLITFIDSHIKSLSKIELLFKLANQAK